jgi:hypothetical protein
LGDLNCNILEPTLSTTRKLQDVLELYQLTQLINCPTRITQSSRSLLDVVIASMPEKIIFSGVVHLGISDHSLIYSIRKINTRIKTDLQGLSSIDILRISMFQAFYMTYKIYLG